MLHQSVREIKTIDFFLVALGHAYCAIVFAVVIESVGGAGACGANAESTIEYYASPLCRRQTRNVATSAIGKKRGKNPHTNAYSDGLS